MAKRATEIKIGELFAGVGGLGLGFILAQHPSVRFIPLFSIDNAPAALETNRRNLLWLHHHAPQILPQLPALFLRDVERLNTRAVQRLFQLREGTLDLLIGGPPCQGFSTSNRHGKKSNKDARNRLVKVFFDKVAEFRPRMFLIENVQGVGWTKPTDEMRTQSFETYRNVRDFMVGKARELDYVVWCDVLNAVDFGVPQHRFRYFMFGVRRDLFEGNSQVLLGHYLQSLQCNTPVTVADAIGDLPAVENGEDWNGLDYKPACNPYVSMLRGLLLDNVLYDHSTTRHQDYVIERYRRIPQGGNWESIREQMSNYSRIENTHSNIYRRLENNAPAITISHFRKSMIIHPTQHRGLSFREAYRLQSFPDWFRFYGGRDERAQLLANAVPPQMARAIALSVACWYLNEFTVRS